MKKKIVKKTMAHDCVLEIGVEELPSPYFDCIYSAKESIANYLIQHGLIFKSLEIFITPRRVVLYLCALMQFQEKKEELIKGPAFDKSYDESGNPSKALEGFLRSKNAKRSELVEINDGKRHCVAVKRIVGGERVEKLLPDILPAVLSDVTFPRTMAWNNSGVRFPRPIRWVMCLYGGTLIRIALAGIKAIPNTFGHRYISSGKIKVESVTDYFKKLKKNNVILREEERTKVIIAGLVAETKKHSLKSEAFDPDLIKTVSRLTESPFIISGEFDQSFLKLPADVLATCMKKHQKIFACYTKNGKFVNKFLAVLDGRRKGVVGIRKGYEHVLESRLKDAAFFIHEDSVRIKRTVNSSGIDERLHEIIFLGGLGTVFDKVERVRSLCAYWGKSAVFEGSEKLTDDEIIFLNASVAASKNDLVTHLVYEFPELQGIAGKEYMKMAGAPVEIYEPISNQYIPKSLSEEIELADYSSVTTGRISSLLGIVDRFDTIVGALGIGFEISGSEDPYALRRASGGIVKLIRVFKIGFSLEQMVEHSYESFMKTDHKLTCPLQDLKNKIQQLFSERIIYEFNLEAGSTERMILDAVLHTTKGIEHIEDVFTRVDALLSVYTKKNTCFRKACKVVERTGNIIKAVKKNLEGGVEEKYLKEDLERTLFDLLSEHSISIQQAIDNQEYIRATELYADTFFETIHAFFDTVLVNVDDEDIRRNRMLLMSNINCLMTERVADLSLVYGLD